MDEGYALILSPTPSPERARAAVAMLVWITQGGPLPGGPTVQTVGQRNRVVDRCEVILQNVINQGATA